MLYRSEMIVSHGLVYRQDFNRVITGYCRDRIGNGYVERGDYQVIDAEDRRISPNELAAEVKPGMILEMSIILRQNAAFEDDKKCPRCKFLNADVTARNGWIEWKVPLN